MRPLIVFDLGNVLVDVDFSRFCHRLARHSGRSPDEVRAMFCQGELKARLDRGVIGPQEFARELLRWHGPPHPTVHEVLDAWCDIFTLRPDTPEMLERLRARNHELWLLSDTDPVHFARVLNDVPDVRGLDRYLLSYARGMLKRDPGAFDALVAQERLGRQVVFVDDLHENIEAARDHGIDAIWARDWRSVEVALHARGLLA